MPGREVLQRHLTARGYSGVGGGAPHWKEDVGAVGQCRLPMRGVRKTWDARGTLKKSAGWADGRGWLPAAANEPLELMSTQQRSGHLEGS